MKPIKKVVTMGPIKCPKRWFGKQIYVILNQFISKT